MLVPTEAHREWRGTGGCAGWRNRFRGASCLLDVRVAAHCRCDFALEHANFVFSCLHALQTESESRIEQNSIEFVAYIVRTFHRGLFFNSKNTKKISK